MRSFSITSVVPLASVVLVCSASLSDGGANNAWYGGFAMSYPYGVDFKAL